MKKSLLVLLASVMVITSPVYAADATTESSVTEDTRTKEEIQNELQEKYGLMWFGDVNNDVTGRWRLSEYADAETFENFAIDYYKAYVEDDKEVHAIINMESKVTYRLNIVFNDLYVTALQYVNGEEHDAKTLFTGAPLLDYVVDLDTGEIQKLEDEEFETETTGNFDAYISLVEPMLQEAYGDNYILTEDGDTISISFWFDGVASEVELASYGNATALSDCLALKDTMSQISLGLTQKLKQIYPNGHLLFTMLNDQNTDNALFMYYDGELKYDCMAQ